MSPRRWLGRWVYRLQNSLLKPRQSNKRRIPRSEFAFYTNFSLRLHYFGEAGKEGDAEAIPFEPA